MKKFDINRFGKVMSRLILVRRRSIIKLFAGFLIGFFVIAIMFFRSLRDSLCQILI